ncbi:heme oxygenase 1 [Fistulifera solaris]|uniref:Heme oxygenase 1 n=1 Tax=Fistulifera solaris TaxID=1519565 RepID=A0A1Z5K4A9_FISSO|nr:heme oxygenase 1 [Fistulifera solaris]|eukprot:GAX21090.1 heme oxygenase 1 [Fistulifera solaris]
MNRTRSLTFFAAFAAALSSSMAFLPSTNSNRMQVQLLHSSSTSSTTSFIENELRGAAMRLHTRQQAPKEGQAPAKKMEPYTPTRADYLQFLIDSQHVYKAFESFVNERPELEAFRNTGLERVAPLETDITFMCNEYGLTRTEVGQPGLKYAEMIRGIQSIPEFMCHYYNFYFAHTAGGRMIGKQMSALLLDKKTLEFYKWDGDLNQIKARVKESIENMAAHWSEKEKQECVDATAAAFQGGGGVNSHLSGGQSPH